MAYQDIIDALSERGLLGRPTRRGYMARCPVHDDRNPSLSVDRGDDDRALVNCFALERCEWRDVIEALGLEPSVMFGEGGGSPGDYEIVRYFDYTDENGDLLYRKNRTEDGRYLYQRWENGRFEWGLADVAHVPYRLDRLVAAKKAGEKVYYVEGEKDAETLNEILGDVGAATTIGGAQDFKPEHVEYFRGVESVSIIADNDDPGKESAHRIAKHLKEAGIRADAFLPPVGFKDVTDAFVAGVDPLALQPFSKNYLLEEVNWPSYTPRPTEWLMDQYLLARASHILYGRRGTGKSLLAMYWAACLAREGKKVAYISLEMDIDDDAVPRLLRMGAPPENMKLHRSFKLGDEAYLEQACDEFQGFSLVVVDSFNASYQFHGHKGKEDDQMAVLDNDYFQPFITRTGASLLFLDNTGHDSRGEDGKMYASRHPRGTSAKQDKFLVELFLSKPFEGRDRLMQLEVQKNRRASLGPTVMLAADWDMEPTTVFYADKRGEPDRDRPFWTPGREAEKVEKQETVTTSRFDPEKLAAAKAAIGENGNGRHLRPVPKDAVGEGRR